MGRYYNGDIEGKFWFAVQPSDAADRFGVSGEQPEILNYYFDKSNIKDVEKGLKEIRKNLGVNYFKIRDFFKGHSSYIHEELQTSLSLPKEKTEWCLREYSDYILGAKIWWCLRKYGECQFEAEC